DRPANANVGSTTAEIACHGGIDVLIVRMGIAVQQRRGRHDLSGLAITALRHCTFYPGLLDLGAVGRIADSFNGDDGAGAYVANGKLARPHRLSPHMHGANAALRDAAAIFGADQIEM